MSCERISRAVVSTGKGMTYLPKGPLRLPVHIPVIRGPARHARAASPQGLLIQGDALGTDRPHHIRSHEAVPEREG